MSPIFEVSLNPLVASKLCRHCYLRRRREKFLEFLPCTFNMVNMPSCGSGGPLAHKDIPIRASQSFSKK